MTRIGGGSPGIGTSPHGASPHGMIGIGIGMIGIWEGDWKENWKGDWKENWKGESLDKRQEESLDKRQEEEKQNTWRTGASDAAPLSKKRNNKGRPAGTGTVSHKRRLHYQQRSYEKRIAREQAEAELKKQEEDRKSTRLNSSHVKRSRMPSSA